MSTEDEFGTCLLCDEDDWLQVVDGKWICTTCEAEQIVQQLRQESAEEYANEVNYNGEA